jgi:hypothetical protein
MDAPDVETWALPAVVVLARATQGCDCGSVAAPDCHAGDSLLELSLADACVVGAGMSRSAAAERGEVLVLHASSSVRE